MIRTAFLLLMLARAVVANPNDGLLLHYTFDEGGGDVAVDHSGRNRDGLVHGCLFLKSDRGFCADINGAGKGQHINCGDLDITGELTLAAWVYAYTWSDKDWSGLVYKSDATYGMRNHYKRPGAIHFQAGDGDITGNTQLQANRWYHIVGVYKPGQYIRLFIDGELDMQSQSATFGPIPTDDQSLMVGRCGEQYFVGRMDEVRVYDRALEPLGVAQLFAREGGRMATPFDELEATAKPAATLRRGDAHLDVYPRGAMALRWQERTWRIASQFSAPVARRNYLSASAEPGETEEAAWRPHVRAVDDRTLVLAAHGDHYRLDRRVEWLDDRILIEDTFTNLTDDVIGIVFWHKLIGESALESWRLFGVENALAKPDGRTPAINPTCFVSAGDSGVAMRVLDDVFRNQLEATVRPPRGSIAFGSHHLGIDRGEQYTTRYAVYLNRTSDYFEFLNRARAELPVNRTTIPGPISAVRTDSWSSSFYRELAADPQRFAAHLDRLNVNVFILQPWYRYWDGFDYTDEQYDAQMREVMKTIRAVHPQAKFLAALETYYYFAPRSILQGTMPLEWGSWSKHAYEFALPPKAGKVIDASPWADSMYRGRNGEVIVSRGDPGNDGNYKNKPLCLKSYPEIGNHFFSVRMAEINHLIDDLGFDGVYMDMFGYGGGNYTFEKWDGQSVDIDGDGRVTMKYADLALITAPARAAWLKNVIAKGKIALVNFGQPNTAELDRIPYYSFIEGAGTGYVGLDLPVPDASAVAGVQLSSPLVLGSNKDADAPTYFKRVRAYLRYGGLHIHYQIRTVFPEQSEGGGSFDLMNRLFPMTPTRLFEGGIEGVERIVTTVSGNFTWDSESAPRVYLFDHVGREKTHDFQIGRNGDRWQVVVQLDDWQDIAIIEK